MVEISNNLPQSLYYCPLSHLNKQFKYTDSLLFIADNHDYDEGLSPSQTARKDGIIFPKGEFWWTTIGK
jgi:hypothetical protein